MSLAAFFKEMHAGNRNGVVSPNHLFGQVVKQSPKFRGMQQQDSPGSGMGEKSGPGYGMNHRDHIFFRELRNNFWVKILKFFDADLGWKNLDPGSGMGKIRIRDPG